MTWFGPVQCSFCVAGYQRENSHGDFGGTIMEHCYIPNHNLDHTSGTDTTEGPLNQAHL